MSIERYIGRTAEIIYLSVKNKFSKRRILIHSIRDGKVRAYDHEKKAFRIFLTHNIMAHKPARRYVG